MPPRRRQGRQAVASTTHNDGPDRPDGIAAAGPVSDPHPARVALLPAGLSAEAKIHLLPSPATGRPSRYLACPNHGFFELRKVVTPAREPRSWMITDIPDCLLDDDGAPKAQTATISRSADLLVASPYDPLFFLIPVLMPETSSRQDDMFQERDNFLDRLETVDGGAAWGPVFENSQLQGRIFDRLADVCDSLSAGGEQLFRLSPTKLHSCLLAKSRRIVAAGLPPSMEESLVRRELERPLNAVPVTDPALTDAAPPTPDTQAEVRNLLRLRVAIDLVLSNTSLAVRQKLDPQLTGVSSLINFEPLNSHMAALETAREKLAAGREIADCARRGIKRSFDAEEQADIRAEKRRKKDEEDRRKKTMSRGVRTLQKVNVVGMKKMSDFFKKTV